MAQSSTMEKALVLILEIESALDRGVRHYNKAGRELTTAQEILDTLMRERRITFEPRAEKE